MRIAAFADCYTINAKLVAGRAHERAAAKRKPKS